MPGHPRRGAATRGCRTRRRSRRSAGPRSPADVLCAPRRERLAARRVARACTRRKARDGLLDALEVVGVDTIATNARAPPIAQQLNGLCSEGPHLPGRCRGRATFRWFQLHHRLAPCGRADGRFRRGIVQLLIEHWALCAKYQAETRRAFAESPSDALVRAARPQSARQMDATGRGEEWEHHSPLPSPAISRFAAAHTLDANCCTLVLYRPFWIDRMCPEKHEKITQRTSAGKVSKRVLGPPGARQPAPCRDASVRRAGLLRDQHRRRLSRRRRREERAVYRHFESKEGLLAAVLEETATAWIDRILARRPPDRGSPREHGATAVAGMRPGRDPARAAAPPAVDAPRADRGEREETRGPGARLRSRARGLTDGIAEVIGIRPPGLATVAALVLASSTASSCGISCGGTSRARPSVRRARAGDPVYLVSSLRRAQKAARTVPRTRTVPARPMEKWTNEHHRKRHRHARPRRPRRRSRHVHARRRGRRLRQAAAAALAPVGRQALRRLRRRRLGRARMRIDPSDPRWELDADDPLGATAC